MLTRRTLLTAAASAPAAAFLTRPAMAAEPEVFADNGIAIRGTDPVAYFTDGAPVSGNAGNALGWRGATWHFASVENMEMFMANPEAYAPQYGGYCAYAMAQGYIATSVPEAWTVHEGRLFLNYSLGVRRRWEADRAGYIVQADAKWPDALG